MEILEDEEKSFHNASLLDQSSFFMNADDETGLNSKCSIQAEP